MRIIRQLAKLQTEYIEKGYTIEQIVETFIQMYFIEVHKRISPELAR